MALRKAKNICKSVNKKSKRNYFKRATRDGVLRIRKLRHNVKPFLTSKGLLYNKNILIDNNSSVVERMKKNINSIKLLLIM